MIFFNIYLINSKIQNIIFYLIFTFTIIIPKIHAQENQLPLVGSWQYGSCRDVEVIESIAYLGNGHFFQTYNVADKMGPEFLGEVKMPGIVDQIVISDDLAFVAIDQDMQIVDISDPGNPVLLGLLDRQFSSIVSMMPIGNYIFLMPGGYFEVIDVSDPTNPVEIEDAFFDSGIKESKLRDNLVYSANSRIGLQIFDVSNPANIVKVSELELGDTIDVNPYSIAIQDNYAFLGFDGTGLAIVDISDPTNPVKISTINPPRDYAYNSHIEVNDNNLYLADASSGEIYIYEVSDVYDPQEIYKSEKEGQIGSMKIREDFLYIACNHYSSEHFSGLQILSIESPVNPIQISTVATPSALGKLKIFEEKNEVYLSAYGVFIIDITDITNPKTKTVIQTGAPIGDYIIIDNYMYATMGEDGFGIFDITDLKAPQQIGHFSIVEMGGSFPADAVAVTIKDHYAFVAITYGGLIVLDITNKSNPQLVKRFSEYSGGMNLDGNYLYVSEFVFGRYIVDISDPSDAKIISNPEEFETPGGFFAHGDYAYLADTTLHVYDISDKSNPIEVSGTHTGVRGYINVLNNKAYIHSRDKDSLFIYDVTEPIRPVPIDSVGLVLGTNGRIIITENYIYTAASNVGIDIYKNKIVLTSVETSDLIPTSFSLSQNYPNPFNPTTTINYEIPEQVRNDKVILKVFDVLGKEVASLVNNHQNAGSYRVEFDASKLSSGIYYYQLRSNSFVKTKKMLLIK